MIVFKIYLIIVLLSIPVFLGIVLVTEYLVKHPKSNKTRKWWSNNVVDLDNKYD